jgi:serine/threonine protein phosphatase PrpC
MMTPRRTSSKPPAPKASGGRAAAAAANPAKAPGRAAPPKPSSGPSAAMEPDPIGWLFLHEGERLVVPRFDFRVDLCAATAQGLAREHNEDRLLCRPDLALFGIADGMGGHVAGEVAAELSLRVAEQHLSTKAAMRVLERYAANSKLDNRRAVFELMANAIRAANEAVLEAGREDESVRGMGTTLDLLLLARDRAFVAHVGDSRAYLVRRTATLQLTNDHAAFDPLRTTGRRVPTARWGRSPLSNSIGASPEVQVDTLFVDLRAGDRFVLATDGIFGVIDSDKQLARLCDAPSTRDICVNLLENVHVQFGHDDATAVVLRIGERFVARRGESGLRAQDMAVVAASPLLAELPVAAVLSTLAACVEEELAEGSEVPCAVANDRVAYLVLDGQVQLPEGRVLGASALLMAPSLLDVPYHGPLPWVVSRARLLRIRHDDFHQVCAHDPMLAAQLYLRIARHLAIAAP